MKTIKNLSLRRFFLPTFALLAGCAFALPARSETLSESNPPPQTAEIPATEVVAEDPFHEGAMQRQAGDMEGALGTYRRILEQNPDSTRAASFATAILLSLAEAAPPDEHARLLEEALDISPGEHWLRAEIIVDAGEGGRAESALRYYENAPASFAPPNPVLRWVEQFYRESGQTGKALTAYRQLQSRSAGDPDAAGSLVTTLAQSGKTDEAADLAEQTLTLYPQQADLLAFLARYRWERGDPDGALKMLERALSAEPRNRDMCNLKVRILTDLGYVGPALDAALAGGDLTDADLLESARRNMAAMTNGWTSAEAEEPPVAPGLLVLAYQDIPADPSDAPLSVDRATLIQHIEYLRHKGFAFVSPGDIAGAARGRIALPANPVLLSFDNAYASFQSEVLPLLIRYRIPALLGVPTSKIGKETEAPPRMTWEQIEQVARLRLVTLASMTHNLDGETQCNPQGDTGPLATERIYDPATGQYETGDAFLDRIGGDIHTSQDLLLRKAGMAVDILVWPSGNYNELGVQKAVEKGFEMLFTCDRGWEKHRHMKSLDRFRVRSGSSMPDFITALAQYRATPDTDSPASSWAMTLDLDLISAGVPDATAANLDKVLKRVQQSGADTVYVQGFSGGLNGSSVEAVYFPNRCLPVKEDILSHVVSRIRDMGLSVFVVMPTLSMAPPPSPYQDQFMVMSSRLGTIRTTAGLFDRLSPFHPVCEERVAGLYADMAAHVDCDGIAMMADAYLSDEEDFNPEASAVYRSKLDILERRTDWFTPEQMSAWQALKVQTLDGLADLLAKTVKTFRPEAQIGRALLPPAVLDPEAKLWLSQDYITALDHYDQVLVAFYPEDAGDMSAGSLADRLLESARQAPQGLAKTVFVVQTHDAMQQGALSSSTIADRVRMLRKGGARHIAYRTDNFQTDSPSLRTLKRLQPKPPKGSK